MTTRWYRRTGNEEQGPFSAAQLRAMVANGELHPSHSVRKGPDGKWYPASSVRGLFAASPEAEKTEPSATPQTHASTRRETVTPPPLGKVAATEATAIPAEGENAGEGKWVLRIAWSVMGAFAVIGVVIGAMMLFRTDPVCKDVSGHTASSVTPKGGNVLASIGPKHETDVFLLVDVKVRQSYFMADEPRSAEDFKLEVVAESRKVLLTPILVSSLILTDGDVGHDNHGFQQFSEPRQTLEFQLMTQARTAKFDGKPNPRIYTGITLVYAVEKTLFDGGIFAMALGKREPIPFEPELRGALKDKIAKHQNAAHGSEGTGNDSPEPASQDPQLSDFRTWKWTAEEGDVSLEALFVEFCDQAVRVMERDGEVTRILYRQLSTMDRDFLMRQTGWPIRYEDKAILLPFSSIVAFRENQLLLRVGFWVEPGPGFDDGSQLAIGAKDGLLLTQGESIRSGQIAGFSHQIKEAPLTFLEFSVPEEILMDLPTVRFQFKSEEPVALPPLRPLSLVAGNPVAIGWPDAESQTLFGASNGKLAPIKHFITPEGCDDWFFELTGPDDNPLKYGQNGVGPPQGAIGYRPPRYVWIDQSWELRDRAGHVIERFTMPEHQAFRETEVANDSSEHATDSPSIASSKTKNPIDGLNFIKAASDKRGWRPFTDAGGRFRCSIPTTFTVEQKESGDRSYVKFISRAVTWGIIIRDTKLHQISQREVDELVRNIESLPGTFTRSHAKIGQMDGTTSADIAGSWNVQGSTKQIRQVKFKKHGYDHTITFTYESNTLGDEGERFEEFLASYQSMDPEATSADVPDKPNTPAASEDILRVPGPNAPPRPNLRTPRRKIGHFAAKSVIVCASSCRFAIRDFEIVSATGRAMLTSCRIDRDTTEGDVLLVMHKPFLAVLDGPKELSYDTRKDFNGDAKVRKEIAEDVIFMVNNPDVLDRRTGRIGAVIEFGENQTDRPLFSSEARVPVKILDVKEVAASQLTNLGSSNKPSQEQPRNSISIAAGKLNVVNPKMGPASIEGDDKDYYYLDVKLETQDESNLVFGQTTCQLSSEDETQYTECWINLTGASAGVQLTQKAPVSFKSLKLSGTSGAAGAWNASKVTGPKGSVECRIPTDGWVHLNFIWPVPRGFSPATIKIPDVVEIDVTQFPEAKEGRGRTPSDPIADVPQPDTFPPSTQQPRRVHLRVEESYTGAEGVDVQLKATVTRMLGGAGVKVVSLDEPAKENLVLTVHGKRHELPSGDWDYTTVELTLTRDNGRGAKKTPWTFSRRFPPDENATMPEVVVQRYKSDPQATFLPPMMYAMNGLASWISETWDVPPWRVLLPIIKHEKSPYYPMVRHVLGESESLIFKSLHDRDSNVRLSAIAAREFNKDTSQLELIALHDGNSRVREAATRVIIQCGGRWQIESLLNASDPNVSALAHKALPDRQVVEPTPANVDPESANITICFVSPSSLGLSNRYKLKGTVAINEKKGGVAMVKQPETADAIIDWDSHRGSGKGFLDLQIWTGSEHDLHSIYRASTEGRGVIDVLDELQITKDENGRISVTTADPKITPWFSSSSKKPSANGKRVFIDYDVRDDSKDKHGFTNRILRRSEFQRELYRCLDRLDWNIVRDREIAHLVVKADFLYKRQKGYYRTSRPKGSITHGIPLGSVHRYSCEASISVDLTLPEEKRLFEDRIKVSPPSSFVGGQEKLTKEMGQKWQKEFAKYRLRNKLRSPLVTAASMLRPLLAAERKAAARKRVAATDVGDELRTWLDVTGKHRTEAVLQKYADDKVVLRKKDGTVVTLPVDRLSKEDQEWLHVNRH